MANINVSEIEYQSEVNPSMLARIYRPTGDGPFPALVSVHGGAWTGNDRMSNAVLDIGLAERGIVVASIDFRLAPQSPYPASIIDINFAVRWFKKHATRYGTRPEFVGGLGTSSGGHQLLLAAMRLHDARYNYSALADGSDFDASLASMVLCWPVVDPATRYRMAKTRQAEDMLRSQEAYFIDERTMDEADPLRCLERGERLDLPRTLVIDGTDDDRLTPTGIEQFVSAFAKAGGKISRERFEGQGHTFIVKDPHAVASLQAVDAIATFVHATVNGPANSCREMT